MQHQRASGATSEFVLTAVKIKRGPRLGDAQEQLTRSLLALALIHHMLAFDHAVGSEAHEPVHYCLRAHMHLLVADRGAIAPAGDEWPLPWPSPVGPLPHASATADLRFQLTNSRDREADDKSSEPASER